MPKTFIPVSFEIPFSILSPVQYRRDRIPATDCKRLINLQITPAGSGGLLTTQMVYTNTESGARDKI